MDTPNPVVPPIALAAIESTITNAILDDRKNMLRVLRELLYAIPKEQFEATLVFDKICAAVNRR